MIQDKIRFIGERTSRRMPPAFFKASFGAHFYRAGIPSVRWAILLASGALLSVLTNFDDRRLLLVGVLSMVVVSGLIRRRVVMRSGYTLCAGAAVLALGLLSAACSAARGWGVLGAAFPMLAVMTIFVLSAAAAGRWHLWETALHLTAQHPWLGIGPLLFAATDNGVASHPHNAVVQWAVEWGLPAASILTATVGWLLIMSLYRARQQLEQAEVVPASLVVAVVASLLAGAAHALVSGVIVMPSSQFMLVVVAAFGLAILGQSRLRRPAPTNDLRHTCWALPVVSIVAALAVLYVDLFTAYDYTQRVRLPYPDSDVYTRNALQPRYWADGTLAPWVAPDGPAVNGREQALPDRPISARHALHR